MKKSILSFTLILSLLFTISVHTSAENDYQTASSNEVTIVYYDDGSYLTIYPAVITSDNASARSSIRQLTASKPITLTDDSGALEWEYVLTATFTVVHGTDSYCLNAHYTQNIYEGSWSFTNGNSYFSGAVAYGQGTYLKKFLGITTRTYNIDISLTCDVYGNVT